MQQKEGPQAPVELLHEEPALEEQRSKLAQVGQKAIATPDEQQAAKSADDQQYLAKAAEGDQQASAALEEQQTTAVSKEPQATAVQKEQQASTAQKEQQSIAAPKEQQPTVAPKGQQAKAVPKGSWAKAAKPTQVGQPAKLTQVGQTAKSAPAGQQVKPGSAQGGQQAKNAGKSGTIKQQQTGAVPKRSLSGAVPRSPDQRKTLLKPRIEPPPIRKVSNLPPTPSTKVGQSWQTDRPPTSKAQDNSKLTTLRRSSSSPLIPSVVKTPPLGASTPKHGEDPGEPVDMDTTIIFDESPEAGSKRRRVSDSSDKAPEGREGKKPPSKKTTA